MAIRRKKSDGGSGKRVFVDLENCELSSDDSETRVRLSEPHSLSDAEGLSKYIGTGAIIVMDLSRFDGSFEERGAFVEKIHAMSRLSNYTMNAAGTIYILTPSEVSVKKI